MLTDTSVEVKPNYRYLKSPLGKVVYSQLKIKRKLWLNFLTPFMIRMIRRQLSVSRGKRETNSNSLRTFANVLPGDLTMLRE